MALTSDYRKREESITFSAEPAGQGETHELLTLNIGPHHPGDARRPAADRDARGRGRA